MTPWWQQLGLVMAGGALGAAGRFLLGTWVLRQLGGGWPWGTFTVNLLGSLAAGFLLVWMDSRGAAAQLWRAFLMIGVLGSLTTWSAMMVEIHLLQRADGWGSAALYVGLSLAGGLLALLLGMQLARGLVQGVP